MPNIDWEQLKTAEQIADEERRARVPAEISRAQGRAILGLRDLTAGVEAYFASITDKEEAMWADLAWNHTSTWRRFDSPFLQGAARALGLSEEDLDEMFIAAAQIVI
ncbi:hypothetical protein ACCQ08_22890 [Comamonas sp. SY3]|uniref:hypothetical protein n=1 Tax=Comamonas sp. SY3 TaxID=3243601 RepID=UPI003593FC01